MTVSRAAIRQAVLEQYELGRLLTATANGNAGGTTFVVGGEIDSSNSANLHNGKWAYDRTQAEERRVNYGGFDPATGGFTVGRAFTAQTLSATVFELWNTIAPSEVNTAMNRALQRYIGYRDKDTSISLDGTSVIYDLPAAIRSAGDVLNVFYKTSASGHEIEVPWYKVRPDGDADGTVTLKLHMHPILSTNFTLVVYCTKRFASLASDAATTEAPVEWVAARTVVELLIPRVRRIDQAKDSGLAALLQQAMREDMRWRSEYLPEHPARITPETPFDLHEANPYPRMW